MFAPSTGGRRVYFCLSRVTPAMAEVSLSEILRLVENRSEQQGLLAFTFTSFPRRHPFSPLVLLDPWVPPLAHFSVLGVSRPQYLTRDRLEALVLNKPIPFPFTVHRKGTLSCDGSTLYLGF